MHASERWNWPLLLGSRGGRACSTRLCVMLAALRNLKAAKEEGLVDDVEHDKARAALLNCDASQWSHVAAAEAADQVNNQVTKLQSSVDQLMGMMVRDSVLHREKPVHPVAKRQKVEVSQGTLVVRPRAREQGQQGIMQLGVTVQQEHGGRVFQLAEDQYKEPELLRFACRFSGCNRRFGRPCELSKHEKTHTGLVKKPRSITEMLSVRALMSENQLRRSL